MKFAGVAALVVGASTAAVPAFAYTDTTPGSGAQVSTNSVAPGSPFTFSGTFASLPAGTVITFSASGAAAGCTFTFNPVSTTLDANHSFSTSVVASAGCAGQNATLTATGPNGQTVSAAIAISGGFPNTSAAFLPIGWLAMAAGAVMVLLGILGAARRRPQAPLAA